MIGTRRVLAVIPARGGSKGVPGKNIHPVGGHPLIAWTVMAANASRYIDHVILSSDDDAIMETARAAGCEVPFRRPAALATDEATSVDVVLDALERTPNYDVIVLLQPTSPLRVAEDIDATLDMMQRCGAPGCVSVCAARDHPWLTFARDEKGLLSSLGAPPANASMRRQDRPDAYVVNGAVYAVDIDWFMDHRLLYAPGLTAAYIMPTERSPDIDTWDDIRQVEERLFRQARVSEARSSGSGWQA
jgi:N-acylneuraminate cytidylyltransferase